MGRLLVIGGNGFVGGELCTLGKKKGFEVAVLDVAETCSMPEVKYYKGDITKIESLRSIIADFSPDIIVNVAAIANIDLAEKNKPLAYAVNVTGAENCAIVARENDAKYVWFSSDAIFSGEEDSYDENSEPNPKNYYGETKLQGEKRIKEENPDAIILRLSLILGVSVNEGNSTLSQILYQLKNGITTKASSIEIRTPIYVRTLGEAIFELCSINYKGIINLGATSSASRYEIAKRIAFMEGYPESLIEPINGANPEKAPRHVNGIINVSKAVSVLSQTKLNSWQETVDLALKNKEGE